MSINTAREAIALLIDLAAKGDIDPWDVDVIVVVDRFLNELGVLRPVPDDLPRSGQAFLWASMLVLYKADTLQALEDPEDPDPEATGEDLPAPEASPSRALPARLEQHLHRRRAAPVPRKRRVTLDELIDQIRAMAPVLDRAPSRPRTPRARPQGRRDAARAIAELAHGENLTELAQKLDTLLKERSQPAPAEWLSFDCLLGWWGDANPNPSPSPDENHSQPGDRVGVFWALLLLSSQSKVELAQQDFYQDLQVRYLCEPESRLPNSEPA